MTNESTAVTCNTLAVAIAETHEEMARLVRRSVKLQERLAVLESQADPDLAEIERVRNELADVNGRLGEAQERLTHLENEYNWSGCPTMG